MPAGFTIYTNGDDTSDFTPNKDLQVGDYKTNSGIQFKVAKLNDSDAISFSNETRASNHTGNVAAHRWFQQNGIWYLAPDTDTQQSVGISLSKTNNGHDLGKSFDITVSKPATDANSPITMDFVGYDSVQKQLQDAIVGEIKGNYNVDPIDGSDQYYLNHQVEYTQPNVTVTSKLSSDGNTITYTVTIDGDYEGFKSNADNDGKKDFIMTLINWKPKDEYDLLPPDNITNPTQDSGNATYPDNSDTYLNGNPIKSQAIKDFLKDKPWTVKVSTTNGDHLSQQTTGYWIDQSTDVKPENNGYVSGLFYEWAKQTIKFVDENGNQMENGGQKIDDHVNNAVFESDTNDFTNVNPQHFDDINVPQIDGYTAYVGVTDNNQLQMNNDKAVTNGQAVTTYGKIDLKPNDNIIEYIVYKANPKQTNTVTIHYIDVDETVKNNPEKTSFESTDGNEIVDQKQSVEGKNVGDSYTNQLWNYEKDGYELATKQVDSRTESGTIPEVGQPNDFYVYLKHRTSPLNDNSTVKETIHYQYENGQKAADDAYQVITFSRSGYQDDVDKKDHWNKWDPETDKFKDVISPTISGYTANQLVVKGTEVMPNSTDQEFTVIYTADSQNLDVTFIDDNTKKTLKTVKQEGPSDSQAKYTTGNDIKNYEDLHYVLVSDDTNKGVLTFDHDSKIDQHYFVHLRHDTNSVNDHVTKNETIHYVYENGKTAKPDYTTNTTFTRTGTQDLVTNKITWSSWTPESHDFKEVDSPAIAGYTPDIAKVNSQTVSPTDQDIEKTVTYYADKQKLDVTFIDDTTGHTLKIVNQEGPSDSQAKYTTGNDIKNYEDLHYVLVSDDTNKGVLTFDHDSKIDQHYFVHLRHDTNSVNDHVTKNETIHYVYENGKTAKPDHTTNTTFTRTGTQDLVTKKITWNGWTPESHDFKEVDSPVIAGYTPNIVTVEAQTVTPSSDNIEKTVVYKDDRQKATVTYIDDTTGKTLQTKELTGGSDSDSGYNTKATIADYEGQNYELVSDSTDGNNVVFDHDDSVDQSYEVHLKHGTVNWTENKTVTETIHYIYQNGPHAGETAAKDYTAKREFTRTNTVDNVTGKVVSYGEWNTVDPFAEVASPVIDGYTADKTMVGPMSVDPDSQNIVVDVYYTMNVNPDNPNNPVIPTPDNPTPNNGDKNHPGSNGQQSSTGSHSSSQASDKQLPQTGDSEKSTLGLGLAALMTTLGLGFRKKRNN